MKYGRANERLVAAKLRVLTLAGGYVCVHSCGSGKHENPLVLMSNHFNIVDEYAWNHAMNSPTN